MTHELKFRYVYGITGKPETYFFRYFTIEEIEYGEPSELLVDWKLRIGQNCKIISRDKFTGDTDLCGNELYENDEISAVIVEFDSIKTRGFVQYDSEYCCFGNQNDGGFTFLSKLGKIKIIGNTYGIK